MKAGWIPQKGVDIMGAGKRAPVHPGGMLLNDYIEPPDITVASVAEMLGVSREAVSAIVNPSFI